MPELLPWAWALLAAGALVVGVSKTAVPGGGILAVAAFAAALPARTSTASLLLLLIVGDLFALFVYRRHAHWPTLLRLAPAVMGGIIVGLFFLAFSDDQIVRRTIGVILLVMIAITLWRRGRPVSQQPNDHERARPLLSATYGTLGGFTTMVANAGGPVMSMYFLATRAPLHVFLGTAAWFFAVVNLVKVPLLAGIGLIDLQTLVMDAVLVPFVVIGAFIGIRLASRMNQALFDRLVIILTVVGAAYLLI